jgi:DnaJ family protein B protein 12
VLSDPDKKAKFDRFGGDPDSRFPGASSAGASPFSNFARNAGAQRQGPMWEEELSPEDLFRQFFGGGGMGGGFGGPFGMLKLLIHLQMPGLIPNAGGGIFDTGPGFVFNVGGGPGIRVHQFGGGGPRRRPATAQPPGAEEHRSISSAMTSLLPILLLFVLPFLSNLFSGGAQGPSVIFDGPKSPYTQTRISKELKIPYYVNPVDVEGFGNSDKKWKELDTTAETQYLQITHTKCQFERQSQRRMMEEAEGWGFFPDEKMIERARNMDMAHCKRLEKLGYGHRPS